MPRVKVYLELAVHAGAMNRFGSSRMRGQSGNRGLHAYAMTDGRAADVCNPWNCFRLCRVDGRDAPDT